MPRRARRSRATPAVMWKTAAPGDATSPCRRCPRYDNRRTLRLTRQGSMPKTDGSHRGACRTRSDSKRTILCEGLNRTRGLRGDWLRRASRCQPPRTLRGREAGSQALVSNNGAKTEEARGKNKSDSVSCIPRPRPAAADTRPLGPPQKTPYARQYGRLYTDVCVDVLTHVGIWTSEKTSVRTSASISKRTSIRTFLRTDVYRHP